MEKSATMNREIITKSETLLLIAYCQQAKIRLSKGKSMSHRKWMDHQLIIIDTWLEARNLTINPYLWIECLRGNDITLEKNQPQWSKK